MTTTQRSMHLSICLLVRPAYVELSPGVMLKPLLEWLGSIHATSDGTTWRVPSAHADELERVARTCYCYGYRITLGLDGGCKVLWEPQYSPEPAAAWQDHDGQLAFL